MSSAFTAVLALLLMSATHSIWGQEMDSDPRIRNSAPRRPSPAGAANVTIDSGIVLEAPPAQRSTTISAAFTPFASVANPDPPQGGQCVRQSTNFYSNVFHSPCDWGSKWVNQGYTSCAAGTKETGSYVKIYPRQAMVFTGQIATCTDNYKFIEIEWGTTTAWVPWKVLGNSPKTFVYTCDTTLPSQGHAIVRHAQYMLGHIYSWGGQSIYGPDFGSDCCGCAKSCCGSKRYGFDCAGLARFAVWQATGVDISGGTEVQIASSKCETIYGTWKNGDEIGNWGNGVPLPGDLIFWGNPTYHVAIYLGWVGGHGDMMMESKQTGWYVGQAPVRWTPRATVKRCWS